MQVESSRPTWRRLWIAWRFGVTALEAGFVEGGHGLERLRDLHGDLLGGSLY
jgi:hypothetical protein